MIIVIAAVGLLLIAFWVWAALVARRWKKTADELAERSWPTRKFDASIDSDPHRLAVATGGRSGLLTVLLVQARRQGLLDVGERGLEATQTLRPDSPDLVERVAAEATAENAATVLQDPSAALWEAARKTAGRLQHGGLWRSDEEYEAYRPLREADQSFVGTKLWTYVVTFVLLFLLLGYEAFTGEPMLSVIIFAIVPWPLAYSWWVASKVQRVAYRLVTDAGYGYRRTLYIRNAEQKLRDTYTERYIKDLNPKIKKLLTRPLKLSDFDLRVALFGTLALKEDKSFQRQVKRLGDSVKSASVAASRAGEGETGLDTMLNDYARFGDGVQRDEITATANLDKKV